MVLWKAWVKTLFQHDFCAKQQQINLLVKGDVNLWAILLESIGVKFSTFQNEFQNYTTEKSAYSGLENFAKYLFM